MKTLFLLIFSLLFFDCQSGEDELEKSSISELRHTPFLPVSSSTQLIYAPNITFFWINLNRNNDRKSYMEYFFKRHQIIFHQRISGIEPSAFEYLQLKKLEKPCGRNTPRDIAVIMSHLKALYTAVSFDTYFPQSEYAVILEDDIKFLYSLNFTALIASAPPDFTILQITTSNPEALQKLWNIYSSSFQGDRLDSPSTKRFWYPAQWTDKTRNGKTYLFWSAQAYIIHKKRIFDLFLSFVLQTAGKTELVPNTPLEQIEYRIINSFYPEKCHLEKKNPCILSNCLFADSYVYAGGKPTYVSTIPLVTGSKIGLNSTIHQAEVDFHKEGFHKIKQITQTARNSFAQHGYPPYFMNLTSFTRE